MTIRLYVVNNSHPCDAVARALELKQLDYTVFEWPPPVHALTQRVIFGLRTVPGISLHGERIQGSRAIFRRLDELVPDPPLYPADPPRRQDVERADRWGDEVFQQVVRDLLWAAAKHRPDALATYTAGSRIPLPAGVVKAIAPQIVRIEQRLNATDDAKAAQDLRDLPAQIAQIDAWIADGTLGDLAHPNAADLQILACVRLLWSVADVRPLLQHSPAPELAHALFGGPIAGEMPVGALAGATI
jgi:glutathione S-transferase